MCLLDRPQPIPEILKGKPLFPMVACLESLHDESTLLTLSATNTATYWVLLLFSARIVDISWLALDSGDVLNACLNGLDHVQELDRSILSKILLLMHNMSCAFNSGTIQV